MKRIKFNFAVLALVLGLAFAFVTTESKSQAFSTLYGYNGQEWVQLTGQLGGENSGDYTCISGGVWCKGNFDTAPDDINDEPINDADRSEGTVQVIP